MKKIILSILVIIITNIFYAQDCVFIDTVYSTAKVKELGNRNICFGIKQMAEDELSNKYCLSDDGSPIKIEVFYFGVPKKSLRIGGMEKTNQITQVGIRFYHKDQIYEGVGESDTEVRASFIELTDGKVPFSKTTVSSAIKKGVQECISKMP